MATATKKGWSRKKLHPSALRDRYISMLKSKPCFLSELRKFTPSSYRHEVENIVADLCSSGLVEKIETTGRGAGTKFAWIGDKIDCAPPKFSEVRNQPIFPAFKPEQNVMPANLKPVADERVRLDEQFIMIERDSEGFLNVYPVRDAGEDPRVKLLREELERTKGLLADLRQKESERTGALKALRELVLEEDLK